jgi:hypothetical protein
LRAQSSRLLAGGNWGATWAKFFDLENSQLGRSWSFRLFYRPAIGAAGVRVVPCSRTVQEYECYWECLIWGTSSRAWT